MSRNGKLIFLAVLICANVTLLPVVALVPKEYDETDVENLKSNLQVEFPVERAAGDLAEK